MRSQEAHRTADQLDQAGKTGGFSYLYMRGAENSHLLIMVDGVKVNDPTTTRGSAYDQPSIDVQQIERIEVLRGPASTIHGGEALAGVVNIITRRSTQSGVSGNAYGAAGQDHHRRVGATVAVGGEAVRGQVSVGNSRDGSSTNVRFAVPAFLSSDTDFRRTAVHATASHRHGSVVSVVVGLEHQNEAGGLNSLGDFDFDGVPDNLQFALKHRTNSVFGEGRVQLAEGVSLQVGLRRDKVQGLDAVTSPHFGAVWDLPNGATTLKGNYSKGFKPPSFLRSVFRSGATRISGRSAARTWN